LSVNGVYFDKVNFNTAYKTLLQTNEDFYCLPSSSTSSATSASSLSTTSYSPSPFNNLTQINRLELLVSRNLSVSLVNRAVSTEFSLTESNSRILSENQASTCLLPQHFLIYDLNNDCLLQQETRETTSVATTNIIPCKSQHNFIKQYRQKKEEKEESSSSSNHSYYHSSKLVKSPLTMVLNTEWTQLEIIELLNETLSSLSFSPGPTTLNTTTAPSNKKVPPNSGSTTVVASQPEPPLKFVSGSGGSCGVGGFGFGITGNKSTGVVVKAITPGGSAFRVNI
jgi:hypothetical protein